jgi:dephospho-CoA kinase
MSMQRIGITGGIASGKSVIAATLRDLDFPVIDADSLAHQLIEPDQPAYAEVVREFGNSILDSAQHIDRAKLGAIVFAERAKLDRLNAIVHPRVDAAIAQQFYDWECLASFEAAFVEAALIIEAGLHRKLDGLIVAWCRPEQQLERLIARGLSEAEARKRIASQMPVDEKIRYATDRIDCSGSLDETRAQVEALAAELRRHPSK